MCGIISLAGNPVSTKSLSGALDVLSHRGPDTHDVWKSPSGMCAMGHKRLSIIDLTEAGRQPMSDEAGRYHIALNGEIYNYIELRKELKANYKFKTSTDTEVLLAAYAKWGSSCLEKLIGMFAFVVWDEKSRTLFAGRDRFGVKPIYYTTLPGGELALVSEIKAAHTLGVAQEPDETTWAGYLAYGLYEHSERTFWKGIKPLMPGHALLWKGGKLQIWKWYDLAEKVQDRIDSRPEDKVIEEYSALLEESIRLRFRSDVPVGINLSGGLDSSILLGLVHSIQGKDSNVKAFTFATGDDRYDELPWVREMLVKTKHPHSVCLLSPEEVPDLAMEIQRYEDEPFGGMPTLAYSKVFKKARELGTIVLLDGQGLDEQWAGYDYYARAVNGNVLSEDQQMTGPVQGSTDRSVRSECLMTGFRKKAEDFTTPAHFSDALRNLQYRDACLTKIPRALRFNDRISMMYSTELREPFLDHRLFELAFAQPADRKIRNGVHKWLLRRIAQKFLPSGITEAPKRPLQTPQREWLRGELREWADACIGTALNQYGGIWLDRKAVLREWDNYVKGGSDNSFYVFQWINLGLWCQVYTERKGRVACHA